MSESEENLKKFIKALNDPISIDDLFNEAQKRSGLSKEEFMKASLEFYRRLEEGDFDGVHAPIKKE